MGKLLRRTFLIGAGAIAGGLAVGYYAYRKPWANPLEDELAEGESTFNPWIKIAADGAVTVIAPRAEMGQGVSTTLAALVCEELGIGLDKVIVEHGPASKAYYNSAMLEEGGPFPSFAESTVAETMRTVSGAMGKMLGLQVTGGSSSIRDAFDKMREAGATARVMLTNAAAAQWGVPAGEISVADGSLVHEASGKRDHFGIFAAAAAAMDVPSNVAPKDRAEWTILGRSQKRTDMLAKVTGAPIFGIDVDLEGMVHATVRMSPVFGARATRADTAPALAVPGVEKVIELDTIIGKGFAVIASNTWAAFKGAEALDIEWEEPAYPADTDAIMAAFREKLDSTEAGDRMRNDGDADLAFADANPDMVVEADYEVPYLAHATMEPMNATAQFADGRLTVWAPNQGPTIVRMLCAGALGIEEDQVTVNTTYMGGGFGRRGESDYAIYAALVAKETGGRPVKVTWTREEDMAHDMYRPAAAGRFRGLAGSDGMPAAIDMRIATPSILTSVMARTFPSLPAGGPERLLTEGAFDQPYGVKDYRVSGLATEMAIPVGFWRSVGNSFNGFFHECFLDELAQKMDADPLAMRIAMMKEHPTAVAVMEKLAEISKWGAPVAADKARGVAFTLSFGGWVGMVADVANTPDGIRIEHIQAVADVGLALDPGIIRAQVISGAVYGISSALMQEISFAGGAVEQGNFYDYDALRINQMPRFTVEILENAPKMGGVGEIGTPPAIPAVVNALSRLTGNRIRRLPMNRELTFA